MAHASKRVGRRGTLVAALVAGAIGVGVVPADACQKVLYDATGKYAYCDLRAFGKLFAGAPVDSIQKQAWKCRLTYARTWSKVLAKYASQGPACTGSRFLDHGDGTVTDRLTGLQWELKTDDDGVHDKDNLFTWSAGISAADGTVFSTFLASLNADPCFAGHCDWRLPTRTELQTLLSDTFPCAAPPCIVDSAFDPTAPAFHWSSTTNATGDGFAWGVQFATGVFGAFPKSTAVSARAVRTAW